MEVGTVVQHVNNVPDAQVHVVTRFVQTRFGELAILDDDGHHAYLPVNLKPVAHWRILARKPRETGGERALIHRGAEYGPYHPWVVATVDQHSLVHGEWYWGHYFKTEEEARAYFNTSC